MSDIFTKQQRSLLMSSIKGRNSKAEITVFKYLNKHNLYYKKHYTSRLGINIDIALPRKKLAVFVDGNFWHGDSYEKLLAQRGSNDYWTLKIKRNMERDAGQVQALLDAGWQVLRVWEKDLLRKSTREQALLQISTFLKR